MTLLLDTHAFLWWVNGEPIPSRAADLLSAREHDILFSAASAWGNDHQGEHRQAGPAGAGGGLCPEELGVTDSVGLGSSPRRCLSYKT
jgi:hypothetical protein